MRYLPVVMPPPLRRYRPTRLAAATLICAALLATPGCAHRVLITSDPPGANVRIGRTLYGPTPQEIRLWYWPLRPMKVRVFVDDYRATELRMGKDVNTLTYLGELLTLRWPRMLGFAVRREHRVVLMREHGPAGTWTPDDVEAR